MRGLRGKSWCPNFFFKYIDNLSTFKTYKLVFTPLLFNASNFHFSKKLLTFDFAVMIDVDPLGTPDFILDSDMARVA